MDSVLSQDYPNIEYIVVDGGSVDGTLDVIRRLEDRIAMWISEPDSGISDAFNKGVALARGEIVGIINSDDWYESNAVNSAVRALREMDADIVCGGMQYWSGEKKSWRVRSDPGRLEETMYVGHPTVFARRNAYRQVGLFRPDFRLAMDYEWLLRAKCAGVKIVGLESCLANMTEGGSSDRRWCMAQMEVMRARAMHLQLGRARLAASFARELVLGSARRLVDRLGLQEWRRWYQRRRRRSPGSHS